MKKKTNTVSCNATVCLVGCKYNELNQFMTQKEKLPGCPRTSLSNFFINTINTTHALTIKYILLGRLQLNIIYLLKQS